MRNKEYRHCKVSKLSSINVLFFCLNYYTIEYSIYLALQLKI
jgi:hypothetical protein